MDRHVFIPTRGRWENIRKLCDVWLSKDFHVRLVVEGQEADKYNTYTPQAVEISVLQQNNMGIAYARNHCVRLAANLGLKSFILADDDIKPSTHRPDSMWEIIEACKDPKILGMTARYSYHDLCMGKQIKGLDDIILLPTGTFRLVGLNVQNVLKLGNYDTSLEYAEDCDLFLRGLQAGFPWMVHLGTFANSIGNRYEPGGMLDFAKSLDDRTSATDIEVLSSAKAKWHKDLHDKYPEIVNRHTAKCAGKRNCIIVGWQRAYDRYLPGWRQWSELHGGDLQKYIDGVYTPRNEISDRWYPR